MNLVDLNKPSQQTTEAPPYTVVESISLSFDPAVQYDPLDQMLQNNLEMPDIDRVHKSSLRVPILQYEKHPDVLEASRVDLLVQPLAVIGVSPTSRGSCLARATVAVCDGRTTISDSTVIEGWSDGGEGPMNPLEGPIFSIDISNRLGRPCGFSVHKGINVRDFVPMICLRRAKITTMQNCHLVYFVPICNIKIIAWKKS